MKVVKVYCRGVREAEDKADRQRPGTVLEIYVQNKLLARVTHQDDARPTPRRK